MPVHEHAPDNRGSGSQNSIVIIGQFFLKKDCLTTKVPLTLSDRKIIFDKQLLGQAHPLTQSVDPVGLTEIGDLYPDIVIVEHIHIYGDLQVFHQASPGRPSSSRTEGRKPK